MANLIKKVQDTIFRNNLFSSGNRIIVGVSGGPDSACLLDILSKLQKKYSLELIITHVNYGLRGNDSDGDEKFVRNLAEKYGYKIFVYRMNAGTQFIASENRLRDIRYDFFEKIRKGNDFDSIAIAHNLDDQAETFLMRIIRGAGLQGLSAIRYKNGPASTRGNAASTRGSRIIRPLLAVSREDILKYLKQNKLDYRIDKTNLESKYLRNKIRNKLIPYLEKNFNSKIKETIFFAVESIAQDAVFLSELAEKEHRKNKKLEINKLAKLHPALLRRVLLEAIKEKKTDLKNIESAHIKELIKILKSTKNKRQTVLFKGLKATRIGDKLIIEKVLNLI